MIKFDNLSQEKPYIKFNDFYDKAFSANQKNIEAMVISTYNADIKKVDSRFVNLKLIDGNNFIFFSNYNSKKSIDILTHNQISALLHWSSINVQVRMAAKIKKTSMKYNQEYFKNRSTDKNALAISSNQSKKIDSYDIVQEKYNKTKKKRKS